MKYTVFENEFVIKSILINQLTERIQNDKEQKNSKQDSYIHSS